MQAPIQAEHDQQQAGGQQRPPQHALQARAKQQRRGDGSHGQGQAEIGDAAADGVAQGQLGLANPQRARIDRQFRQRRGDAQQQQAGSEGTGAEALGEAGDGLDDGIPAQRQQQQAKQEPGN